MRSLCNGLANTSILSKWQILPPRSLWSGLARTSILSNWQMLIPRSRCHDFGELSSWQILIPLSRNKGLASGALSDVWQMLAFRSRCNNFVDSLICLKFLCVSDSMEESGTVLFSENTKNWRSNALFVRRGVPWPPGSKDVLEPMNTLFCLGRVWPEA